MDTRLKEVLMERRISASELGRKIGTSAQYVSNVANGRVNVSTPKMKQIADALGVPLASLYDGWDEPHIICPHCGKKIKVVKE